MKFESIEFKNIFAYGEQVQRIDYSENGELILLKGMSGSGKSSILSLPTLLLYGKITKTNKSDIANRTNKHGWIRGTIKKGQHTYVIEREFSPNSLHIWKDGFEVDIYGTSSGEEYIANEIVEMPIATFSNMISISMKKFKSFLTLSPTERKQIVDEVFDVRIINVIFDQIKKDCNELGKSINGDNLTLFQLQRNLASANDEMVKAQQKNASEGSLEKIEANNKRISELNASILQYNDGMKTVNEKFTENDTAQRAKHKEITEVDMVIRTINEKINLFNQSKCPTCGTAFEGDYFNDIKKKLQDLYNAKQEERTKLNAELTELSAMGQKIRTASQTINDAITKIRMEINNLTAENRMLDEKMKSSAECQAVQNIIDGLNKQIDEIRDGIKEKEDKIAKLQKLMTVYSIDGVTKMVIDNYLPLLNQEISENLLLLNMPYTLTIDSTFNTVLKDLGDEINVSTISDGEQTRVDLVVLLSLYRLIKRRYSDNNILFIDEVVSSLDVETSGIVIGLLKYFAEEMKLNIFVVSHTNLDLDNFDKIIEVEKTNGFSHIVSMNEVD